MKIALLTDGIHPIVVGGMQRHSYYLVKYLAKNKINVDLYHGGSSAEDEPLVHKLFTDEENSFIRSTFIKFPRFTTLPGHYLRESFEYSNQVFEKLKEVINGDSKPDFIYVKGFSGWKLLREKAKGLQLPPLGINFHGFEMFQRPASLKNKLEHWILRGPARYNTILADYVFSYGGKITKLIQRLGVPTDQIIEIPAGIESNWLLNALQDKPKPVRFVFVGRYERRKGIEELNRVIKDLLTSVDFEFHFIGPIDKAKRVRSSKLKYWGEVKNTGEIQQILDSCHVLVCPSHSEGMPNVILEGMSRGLAVIASDVGAVNNVVSDSVGWLINPGDESTLKDALVDSINLPGDQLLQKRTEALKRVRDNFLWENIIEQTLSEIKRVCSKAI